MSACFSQLGCFNIPLAGRHCFIQPIHARHSNSSYVVGGCINQRGPWIFLECARRWDEHWTGQLSYAVPQNGCKALPCPTQSRLCIFRDVPNRLRHSNKVYKLLVFQNSIEDMFFIKFFMSSQIYVISFSFVNLSAILT